MSDWEKEFDDKLRQAYKYWDYEKFISYVKEIIQEERNKVLDEVEDALDGGETPNDALCLIRKAIKELRKG